MLCTSCRPSRSLQSAPFRYPPPAAHSRHADSSAYVLECSRPGALVSPNSSYERAQLQDLDSTKHRRRSALLLNFATTSPDRQVERKHEPTGSSYPPCEVSRSEIHGSDRFLEPEAPPKKKKWVPAPSWHCTLLSGPKYLSNTDFGALKYIYPNIHMYIHTRRHY